MSKKMKSHAEPGTAKSHPGIIIISESSFLQEKISKNMAIFPFGLIVKVCSDKIKEINSSLKKEYKILIISNQHSQNSDALDAIYTALQELGYDVVMLKTHAHPGENAEWIELKPRLIRSAH